MTELVRPAEDRAAFRLDRLKRAALSSIAPKATTLLMQLLALPIAARTLGTASFALYVLVAAAMMWLNLAMAALFPGLVTRATATVVRGDLEAERGVIGSALAITTVFSVTMLLLCAVVLSSTSPATLWGPEYAAAPMVALTLLFVGSAVVGMLMSVVEGAQLAHHEQHVSNSWNAAGNLLGFLALLAVAWLRAGLIPFVIAIQVIPQLGRVANSWLFFTRWHQNLRPTAADVTQGEVLSLLRRSGGFSLVAVGGFLNHQLPLIVLARFSPAEQVAVFGALMNAFLLAFGVLSMFTTAIWPALADARGRGEYRWVAALCRRAATVAVGYGVLGAVGLAVGGGWLVRRWYGLPVVFDAALPVWLGVYFLAAVWEHVLYNLLVGLQFLRSAIVPYALRSVVVMAAVPFAIRLGSTAGAAALLSLSALLSTVWWYPFALRRGLLADLRAYRALARA